MFPSGPLVIALIPGVAGRPLEYAEIVAPVAGLILRISRPPDANTPPPTAHRFPSAPAVNVCGSWLACVVNGPASVFDEGLKDPSSASSLVTHSFPPAPAPAIASGVWLANEFGIEPPAPGM